MRKLHTWGCLVALVLTGVAHAQDEGAVSPKLVVMSASMNEMAVACGHMSASEVAQLLPKQRESMLQAGITAAQYEAAYAQGKAEFAKRWSSAPKTQQAQSCAHIKTMSEQSAAQAKEIEKKMR